MDYSPPGSSVLGFSRQAHGTGLPFPSPADLLDPGIEPLSLALTGRFFITEPPGKSKMFWGHNYHHFPLTFHLHTVQIIFRVIFERILNNLWASLVAHSHLPAMRETWVGKIPWRRKWLPTPVFWPGEFHGLHSPWGRKESDTTERLSLSFTLNNLWSCF